MSLLVLTSSQGVAQEPDLYASKYQDFSGGLSDNQGDAGERYLHLSFWA